MSQVSHPNDEFEEDNQDAENEWTQGIDHDIGEQTAIVSLEQTSSGEVKSGDRADHDIK